MSTRKKPYEFSFEYETGDCHIYANFNDAYDHRQEVEVSKELHVELTLLNRSVRNLESCEERHKEYLDLTDEELVSRGIPLEPSAEDIVLDSLLADELKDAFRELPAVQARRFLLVHALDFSYADVAQMEGCSSSAVKHSLIIAKKNLRKILGSTLPDTPSEFGSK